jgi:hypothetical protein
VFQVDIDANENETVIREVTGAQDVHIEWTVHLANRKAAARQIFGDGSGTLTRNPAARLRNAGFDRETLVIESVASIKNGAGAAATTMTGLIAFAKAGKVHHRVDDIVLATLRTDDAGRLIVSAGLRPRGLRRTRNSSFSRTTTAGMTASRMVRSAQRCASARLRIR